MMYAPWEIANETGWILDTPFGQSLRSITEGMSEADYARSESPTLSQLAEFWIVEAWKPPEKTTTRLAPCMTETTIRTNQEGWSVRESNVASKREGAD